MPRKRIKADNPNFLPSTPAPSPRALGEGVKSIRKYRFLPLPLLWEREGRRVRVVNL